MKTIKAWIEAMRLRTLPVSLAGIILAIGYARIYHCFKLTPVLLCLIFALLAQIASNFANEYYDFKGGLDKAGREGPRRGVTEGDISPRAMQLATFSTLALACITGCSLLIFGEWWLIPIGIAIALGVLAYSTGPYPLSHHGLGEVAVLIFFGIIPVNLTFYLQSGTFTLPVFLGSISAGLMGANVLLVNNYRDIDDDKAVGKNTIAVLTGRRFTAGLYLISGLLALAFIRPQLSALGMGGITAGIVYLILHIRLWLKLTRHTDRRLNPVLGMTSVSMAIFCTLFALAT